MTSKITKCGNRTMVRGERAMCVRGNLMFDGVHGDMATGELCQNCGGHGVVPTPMRKVEIIGGRLSWRTKDGTYVPLLEMSDEHLLNTQRLQRQIAARAAGTWRDLEWAAKRLEELGGPTLAETAKGMMEDAAAGEHGFTEQVAPLVHLDAEVARRGLEPLKWL